MKQKLLLLLTLLVCSVSGAWAQTVLFQQNFNSGKLDYSNNLGYTKTKTLANIVGDGDNLFTSIKCGSTAETGIAINSTTGGNSVDATGFFQAYYNNTYAGWFVYRTNNFATTAPTAIMMSFDVWINLLYSDIANGYPGVQFGIGDGLTDGSTTMPSESLLHSAFSISAGKSEDPSIYDYRDSNSSLHTKLYSTALTQSKWLSFTWVINNTGQTLTYDNPTGSGTSTVNNDCFDLWLKTTENGDNTYTRVIVGQAATTANKDLQEMYIGYPGLKKKMEFRMDNILVTDLTPASDAKDYTVTVESNNESYGTVTAGASSLDASETTQITAEAESGYKFRSWAVSGTGASLSSTTTNPTTLTMGTANATVTATFTALEHYTITYNKGEHGSGSAIADGDKTEDAAFTLSSSKYTYSGHVQTGWATSDGGDKAYDLGGTYTGNADLDLYPYWIEQYTIIYNANGGSGSMSNTENLGDITLTANAYTKLGYTFIGWATSKDDADAGTVAYADKAAYSLTADATLYAVWGENYCELKPETSGSAPSAGDAITMQSGAFGGTMTVKSSAATLNYTSYGLSSFSGETTFDIALNDYMKPGSVISMTLYAAAAGSRGFDLYTSGGEDKITTFAHTNAGYATYQYTVTDDDGLDGTYSFRLTKETYTAMIYLTSLTVTDCQPGGVITASGWSTYSSNKKLDLSTISGGTAYIATTIDNTEDKVKMVKCTDIVDAEEGLMIKGTAGDKFTINTSSSDATLSETNLLKGVPNGGSAPVGSYVFGWTTGDPTDYGFYNVNVSAVTLGAGKAYLTTGTGARLSLVFDDEDEATGISSLTTTPSLKGEGSIYSLDGRRVIQPKKGLYIKDGRKVVIK